MISLRLTGQLTLAFLLLEHIQLVESLVLFFLILDVLPNPLLVSTKNLGTNAKKHVASEYTWDNTAKKTEAVYEHVLGGICGSSWSDRGNPSEGGSKTNP